MDLNSLYSYLINEHRAQIFIDPGGYSSQRVLLHAKLIEKNSTNQLARFGINKIKMKHLYQDSAYSGWTHTENKNEQMDMNRKMDMNRNEIYFIRFEFSIFF